MPSSSSPIRGEFVIEMQVAPRGPLVGSSIEEAGLRNLPGVFLAEIHRRERVIPAVAPHERMEAGDQLIFVGLIDAVVELQRIPGLDAATQQLFELDRPRSERWFIEAVVAGRCPLVGSTIKEGRFRQRYGAVVLGVARQGERVKQRLGDVVLEPGDVLLLEAPPRFVHEQRNGGDFFLVSRIHSARPPAEDRAPWAIVATVAMVLLASFHVVPMLHAAVGAAVVLLLTGTVSDETARRRIDWTLPVAIAAAFGLGMALEHTGVSALGAAALVDSADGSPWLALVILYAATMLLSELVTNSAAAAIMFPFGFATALGLGVDPMPFAMTVLVASSAAFATPLGYQTNLMVYGAGGYRVTDFVRIGLPLNVLVGVVAIAVIPHVWPF